eukprot:Clim_evm2s5 gene=Clim_evmTU2s5
MEGYEFLSLLIYLYMQVRTFFSKYWMQACKWTAEGVVPAAGDTRLKVVVIGDGYAAGFGDYNIIGRYPGIPYNIPNETAKETALRIDVRTYSAGVLGSTAKDWEPKQAGGSSLYDSMIKNNAKYQDAQYIIVIVGSNDYRLEVSPSDTDEEIESMAQSTVRSIERLVMQLYRDGKKVFLAKVPLGGDLDVREKLIKAKNEKIAALLKQKKCPIHEGPELDYIRNPNLLAFDKRHFNSAGYAQAARMTWQKIRTYVMKDQFDYIKGHYKAPTYPELKAQSPAERKAAEAAASS